MTELKPCPFCGEESNIYLGDSTDGYIRRTQNVEVYCNKCGASIKRHLVSEAIEAWNTRSNPWHTEPPTEEGWYLIQDSDGAGTFFETEYFDTERIAKWSDDNKFDGLAWQKIEPLGFPVLDMEGEIG